MELKSPSPLGEKKISEKSITQDILEIAKEKEFKRKQRTKIPIPTLNLFKKKQKTDSPVIIENQTVTQNIQNDINSNRRSLSTLISNIKNLSIDDIKIYLSTHKEQVINISLILIPLIILFILIIVITSYTRSQPFRIANEFIEKIEQRDISSAYNLTSDAYRAVTTEKEFIKVVDNLNTVDISNRKIKKKSIDNEKEMGQYAYIKYKVSGSFLDLVIYNDTLDWRVHSIQLSTIK